MEQSSQKQVVIQLSGALDGSRSRYVKQVVIQLSGALDGSRSRYVTLTYTSSTLLLELWTLIRKKPY